MSSTSPTTLLETQINPLSNEKRVLPLTVFLTEQEMKDLSELALQFGVSVSDIVEFAIKNYDRAMTVTKE